MRLVSKIARTALIALVAACGDTPTNCCEPGSAGLRIINAYTKTVQVSVDGTVAIAALDPGAIDTVSPQSGSHVITLNATNGGSAVQTVTTVAGALNTIAVVKSSIGAVSTASLDDTNSIVPAGATKVRVLHLAPNAGTLQVYRTQPNSQQPTSWQSPFTYQSEPTSLSAPFYQSTVGTWEVRIWQTPADASGWATASVKAVIPLGSGEKKTILILDLAGGGVRVEIL